ncbi:MAG: hypothetical protein ABUT39_28150 [Acidobacteriota bacterium]
MGDLKSSGLIKLKGVLFLVLGLASSALLLFEAPTLKVAALLGIAVWSFCRFYYFAFYVIERYVDPGYRFSGLMSFARYLIRGPAGRRRSQ